MFTKYKNILLTFEVHIPLYNGIYPKKAQTKPNKIGYKENCSIVLFVGDFGESQSKKLFSFCCCLEFFLSSEKANSSGNHGRKSQHIILMKSSMAKLVEHANDDIVFMWMF